MDIKVNSFLSCKNNSDENCIIYCRNLYLHLMGVLQKFPLASLAVGDLGGVAILALLAKGASAMEKGTTLAAISAGVEPNRLATARRVRAMLEWLCHCGGALRERVGKDRRKYPFRMDGWLKEAVFAMSRAVCMAAIQDILPVEAMAEGFDDRFFSSIVQRLSDFVMAGGFVPDEIEIFTTYRGGYILLLHLLAHAFYAPDGSVMTCVSRKALSGSIGVSRAQLTAIIARAEKGDMLRRMDGETILLHAAFYRACIAFFQAQRDEVINLAIAASL